MTIDRTMLVLLSADPAATSARCLHDVLYLTAYPEPDWISGPHIVDMLLRAAAVALVPGRPAFRAVSVSAVGHCIHAPPAALPATIQPAAGRAWRQQADH